jgi:hypothetical protein
VCFGSGAVSPVDSAFGGFAADGVWGISIKAKWRGWGRVVARAYKRQAYK